MKQFDNRRELLSMFRKYVDGSATPEEKQFVEAYYHFFDRDSDVIDQEKEIMAETDASYKSELEEVLWEKVQSQIHRRGDDTIVPLKTTWWQTTYFKVAAAVLVLLSGWLYFSREKLAITGRELVAEMRGLQTINNRENVNKEVILEDGTHITLEPGGSLKYAKPFSNNQRIVHLTGNAFFNVTKNPAKPFLVYSRDIVTRVIGTSFTIRYERKNLEVAVLTGRVIVEKVNGETVTKGSSGGKGIVLTPNQKVTYFQEKNHFVTGLVSQPVLVRAKAGQTATTAFDFEDAPLSDVIDVLEAAYGIEILIRSEKIKSCPVRADLTQQPLYTKLDIICAALKAHYDVRGTTIIITGGECE